MRFVLKGPNVPNHLLSAHEKGEVVFFCGAGISMREPTKLPSFRGLVESLFKECNHASEWETREDDDPFDESLAWLESTVTGGRERIIRHVHEILTPKNKNSPIHEALLALARPRNSDATMLVTTNFDRLFEQCLLDYSDRPQKFVAPRLPIARPNGWDENGIVYLHGLIPEDSKNSVHSDNLVLTSSDLGRAYLSERWATRFVAELFRNYVVCFVGYSLNDPVIRYLNAALADDDKGGTRLPKRYIFLSKEQIKNTSEKNYPGLTIISYDETDNHRLLHETFTAWADDHNDQNTKKQVIQKFINSNNSDLSRITEFRADPNIDRFMWALHDKEAAHFFATMHPRPTWELINVLDAKEFGFDDLISFGHSNIPTEKPNDFQNFSLLEPMIKSEDMTYWNISDRGFYSEFSPVHYFYQWIARHLDNQKTALWVAGRCRNLNAEFKNIISRKLGEGRGTADDPESYIRPIMHEVWELIFSDNIYNLSLYDMMTWRIKLSTWIERHEQTGLTSSLKRQLEQIIQPKVKLSPKAEESEEAKYIEHIFRIEIDFVQDQGFDRLKKIALREETPDDDKLFYIDFFHFLLCKIFTLADRFCDDKGDFIAFSDIDLSSILYEEQKHFYHEWHRIPDAMSELLGKIAQKDQEKAKAIVMEWLHSRHTFINRLGLHCLRESPLIDSESIAKAILNNATKLLTNGYADSEIIPLLRDHAAQFSEASCHRIQVALLTIGGDGRYNYLIIAYLKALQEGGINLLEEAKTRLEELKEKRGYSDNVSPPKPAPPPSVEDDIQTWAQYLEGPPKDQNDPYQQNLSRAWNNFCETDPLKAFKALKLLNIEKGQSDQYSPWHSFFGQIDPIIRQQAKALSDKGSDDSQKEKLKQSDIIAIIDYWLDSMEESNQLEFLSPILDIAESSLRLLMPSDKGNALLKRFMERAMALLPQYQKRDLDDELNKKDILFAAINNPIGKFVELVMQYQMLTSPQYDDGLLPITKQFFEKILSDTQLGISHYGLCVIARRLIYLFSYDKEWTNEKLIPCFSWDDASKARVAWSGYLAHARWMPDLIESLSDDLLATIGYIERVNMKRKNIYAHLIGSLALDEKEILSVDKLRECIAKFDEFLLCSLLRVAEENFEAVEKEEKRAFFESRIEPFFKQIWQNDIDKLDASMANIFMDIILAAEDAFPDTVNLLGDQLAVTTRKSTDYLDKHFYSVLQSLQGSNYAERFPEATLDLLVKTLAREIALDKEDKEIWEKHILVHLVPLNDKRLENIKRKLK